MTGISELTWSDRAVNSIEITLSDKGASSIEIASRDRAASNSETISSDRAVSSIETRSKGKTFIHKASFEIVVVVVVVCVIRACVKTVFSQPNTNERAARVLNLGRRGIQIVARTSGWFLKKHSAANTAGIPVNWMLTITRISIICNSYTGGTWNIFKTRTTPTWVRLIKPITLRLGSILRLYAHPYPRLLYSMLTVTTRLPLGKRS